MKIRAGNISVEITHPDKVLFPKGRITKLELVEYYRSVSRLMLPHLKDRPISMKKYPKGIKGEGFFQKHAPEGMPSWVKTAKVKRKEGAPIDMVLCQDTASLLWLANQNCITPHIWLSKINRPDTPDRIVFDLDPPPRKTFAAVVEGALLLREILRKEYKLKAFVTTTGSKGLHVVVPIQRKHSFAKVRGLAREIADRLVEEDPKKFTTAARKEKRGGRLYIDTMRNGPGQTVMAPYSVRPIDGAPVATPLAWEELNDSSLRSDTYNIRNIQKRFGRNPWAGMERSAKMLVL